MTYPFVYMRQDDRPSEVVSDPEILGETPCIRGTRVPAETIADYIRGGISTVDILNDYPTLPNDGIEAVRRWAVGGRKWRFRRTRTGAS